MAKTPPIKRQISPGMNYALNMHRPPTEDDYQYQEAGGGIFNFPVFLKWQYIDKYELYILITIEGTKAVWKKMNLLDI